MKDKPEVKQPCKHPNAYPISYFPCGPGDDVYLILECEDCAKNIALTGSQLSPVDGDE